MPREFSRTERIADALQQDLAELVRNELRDPRVGMVNITGVEVSRDLAQAKVFVNFVGVEEQSQTEAAVAVLNGAAGFLRSLLARSSRLRHVPKLRFIFDASGIQGQKLSSLIDRAVARDRQLHDSSGDE